jgi:hypothetical protein
MDNRPPQINSSHRRLVWLLAKPLSAARNLPLLGLMSHGKLHFCHWGILIATLGASVVETLLSGIEHGLSEMNDLELGVMWELNRTENDRNTVNVTRPFTD